MRYRWVLILAGYMLIASPAQGESVSPEYRSAFCAGYVRAVDEMQTNRLRWRREMRQPLLSWSGNVAAIRAVGWKQSSQQRPNESLADNLLRVCADSVDLAVMVQPPVVEQDEGKDYLVLTLPDGRTVSCEQP